MKSAIVINTRNSTQTSLFAPLLKSAWAKGAFIVFIRKADDTVKATRELLEELKINKVDRVTSAAFTFSGKDLDAELAKRGFSMSMFLGSPLDVFDISKKKHKSKSAAADKKYQYRYTFICDRCERITSDSCKTVNQSEYNRLVEASKHEDVPSTLEYTVTPTSVSIADSSERCSIC